MKIEGVEVNIYFDDETNDGQCSTIDLSPMQTKVMLAALGITNIGENTINCFSDEGLQKVLNLLRERIKIRYLE